MINSNILLCLVALIRLSIQYTIPFFKNMTEDVNLTSLYHHLLYTNLCIGTPRKCFVFPIHFDLYPTWICGSYYSRFDSLTYSEGDELEALYTSASSFISKRTEDIAYISTNLPFRLNYWLADSSECQKKGMIGELGFGIRATVSKSKYGNFMEQLSFHSIIQQETVLIKYTNATNGAITIGESIPNYKHFKQFIIMSTQNISLIELVAKITQISLIRSNAETFDMQLELKARISYQISPIIVPMVQFNQITFNFLSQLFLNGVCIYSFQENSQFNYEIVYCNKNVIHRTEIQLKEIELIFGTGDKIAVPLKDLFIESNNYFIFGIVGERDYEIITIGDIILRRYMVYLDRDKRKISLFPNDEVNKLNSTCSESKGRIKMLFAVNIFLCFITSIAFSVLYYIINTKMVFE